MVEIIHSSSEANAVAGI